MDEPTCVSIGVAPVGFARDAFEREIGVGDDAFDRAREGLRRWEVHRAAGVEVYPPDTPIDSGETIGLVTRQLGAWVLASYRLVEVVDESHRFGFTDATLPGQVDPNVAGNRSSFRKASLRCGLRSRRTRSRP